MPLGRDPRTSEVDAQPKAPAVDKDRSSQDATELVSRGNGFSRHVSTADLRSAFATLRPESNP